MLLEPKTECRRWNQHGCCCCPGVEKRFIVGNNKNAAAFVLKLLPLMEDEILHQGMGFLPYLAWLVPSTGLRSLSNVRPPHQQWISFFSCRIQLLTIKGIWPLSSRSGNFTYAIPDLKIKISRIRLGAALV